MISNVYKVKNSISSTTASLPSLPLKCLKFSWWSILRRWSFGAWAGAPRARCFRTRPCWFPQPPPLSLKWIRIQIFGTQWNLPWFSCVFCPELAITTDAQTYKYFALGEFYNNCIIPILICDWTKYIKILYTVPEEDMPMPIRIPKEMARTGVKNGDNGRIHDSSASVDVTFWHNTI